MLFSFLRMGPSRVSKTSISPKAHADSIFNASEISKCETHSQTNCVHCNQLGFDFRFQVDLELIKLSINATDKAFS